MNETWTAKAEIKARNYEVEVATGLDDVVMYIKLGCCQNGCLEKFQEMSCFVYRIEEEPIT
jgi:hypothetical protein